MEMNLHKVTNNQFTSYSDTSVTVNQKDYTTNIIVTNDNIYNALTITVKDIKPEDLSIILDFTPDLVIFGTGNNIIYPDINLLKLLAKHSIGFEVMSIKALCRTYNFLLSEGRKIVCLLLF